MTIAQAVNAGITGEKLSRTLTGTDEVCAARSAVAAGTGAAMGADPEGAGLWRQRLRGQRAGHCGRAGGSAHGHCRRRCQPHPQPVRLNHSVAPLCPRP